MENASKALIIAGAILLSILLISLGIYIFQQANGVINSSGMTKAEISAFNQQFTKYDGKQKGSNIRLLVQEVIANNNSDEASDETVITIDGDAGVSVKGEVGNASPTYGKLQNTKTYYVSFSYRSGSGRVETIHVNTSEQQ